MSKYFIPERKKSYHNQDRQAQALSRRKCLGVSVAELNARFAALNSAKGITGKLAERIKSPKPGPTKFTPKLRPIYNLKSL